MTAPYVAPRNAVESRLIDLWTETLGGDVKIGIIDNLFDLGGDSAQMTRIITLISQDSGVELTIRNLFDAPTIQSLAELIEQRREALLKAG